MITTRLLIIISSLFISGCDYDVTIDELEQLVEKNDSALILNDNESTDSTKTILPPKTNNDSFKILAIGNSFTDDALAYLPDLINHAGLHHVKLGKIVVGGTSLEYHYSHAVKNDDVYSYSVAEEGKDFKYKRMISLCDAICDDQWDVVVMQQVSQLSGLYDTYHPFLDSLIVLIHRQLPKTVIGWQMTWAYGSKAGHSGFSNYDRNQTKMYDAICDAVNKAVNETNIDVVIPSGIAIQKVRATSVNNPLLDLTRDGSHLDYGAGRYIVACTWFESLIAQVYHTSVVGNTLRTEKGNVPVTDENASICQQAAHDAVEEFKCNSH